MNANDERLAALYDYPMYKKLVAQHPLPKRDSSRLMVLNRVTGRREHRRFSDIVRYLKRGDALVLNNSQVIPARLTGRRTTGGSVKILLVNGLGNGRWRVLLETRGKPRIGEEVTFGGGAVTGTLSDRLSSREWVMDFGSDNGAWKLMNQFGRMPLPPYIKRPATDTDDDPFLKEDIERYQSVFALRPGSIAAPTAGLHFTTSLLKTIERKGVEIIYVTLHVGLGTFTPIRSSDITRHRMEKEHYELDTDAARRLDMVRERGGRVFAAGSTCCRVLETLAREGGKVRASKGTTELFIHPPYRFKVVDGLLTNFHLPKTTLLVLVAAFAGRSQILDAYAEAAGKGYRFYSYGDAMLII